MAYGAAGEAAGPIPGDTVQLRTLTRIRWVAIAGQVAALTVVHYDLGFPVPFGPACGGGGAVAMVFWQRERIEIRDENGGDERDRQS